MPGLERVADRLRRSWSWLGGEQRLAGLAALGLFGSMFLPWYQTQAISVSGARLRPVADKLTAFGVFSFVEAAVLLVATAVLLLLFARGEGRRFYLPGGDGPAIVAAGLWSALLIAIRFFDKPDASAADRTAVIVGVQWGIFVALAAAGALAYAGTRMAAAHRPEPPRSP